MNEKLINEGNQIHNFMSSSGSGTVINYGSDSDFLTSYGSGYGSGSTSQKVTVPTVPVPQHCENLVFNSVQRRNPKPRIRANYPYPTIFFRGFLDAENINFSKSLRFTSVFKLKDLCNCSKGTLIQEKLLGKNTRRSLSNPADQ